MLYTSWALAEREGFEPSVPLRAHMISKGPKGHEVPQSDGPYAETRHAEEPRGTSRTLAERPGGAGTRPEHERSHPIGAEDARSVAACALGFLVVGDVNSAAAILRRFLVK